MQVETISVTAVWGVTGLSSSFSGSKSFSMHIDSGEQPELIEERARSRARQLIAMGGNWSPNVVRISDLRITRPQSIGR